MILDANSDHLVVRQTLDRLLTKMEELQKFAFTYKSYQKNFKVRVIVISFVLVNLVRMILHNRTNI